MSVTDTERREVARKLRRAWANVPDANPIRHHLRVLCAIYEAVGFSDVESDAIDLFDRLADLIEPDHKPDAEYEAWYNGLSHWGDERGGPSTIRELIEEIVWAAITVDLGPDGNIDPLTGSDNGEVCTDNLFAEWEREALRLSGGCDRDALLALADEMEIDGAGALDDEDWCKPLLVEYARRIREALGVER